jgi:hypothetical protein
MGERRGAYRILVGEPDGKRPLGKPRRRWKDNIKIDISAMGRHGLAGACECGNEPPGSLKCGEFLD